MLTEAVVEADAGVGEERGKGSCMERVARWSKWGEVLRHDGSIGGTATKLGGEESSRGSRDIGDLQRN